MVKFTEVIDASIEWAALVLFRPFKPKKWLILGFVALMAGYMSFHSNINLPGNSPREGNKQTKSTETVRPSSDVSNQGIKSRSPLDINRTLSEAFSQKRVAISIILIILIVLAIIIIWMWLGSRFAFIFLEDVVKNDASIKMPFKQNKKIGDSLFLFYFATTVIFLLLLGVLGVMCIHSLIKLGAFDRAATIGFMRIFLTCLPYGLALLFSMLIYLIILIITNHFVSIVMFKDRIKITQAWPRTLSLLGAHKGDFIIFIFIAWGLGICCGVIYMILFSVAYIGLLLPVGILYALFYFLYLLVPEALRIFYFIFLFSVAVPIALFLLYCLSCLHLPFAVFFRTISLKFIGRLDQRYNLFKITPNEEGVL